MDYGHEEAQARDGKDPRTYAISTKVDFLIKILKSLIDFRNLLPMTKMVFK